MTMKHIDIFFIFIKRQLVPLHQSMHEKSALAVLFKFAELQDDGCRMRNEVFLQETA